jgi:adenosine/AMP kinase
MTRTAPRIELVAAGVIDGEPPLGVENEHDVEARKRLLRDIGYKL